MNKHRRWVLAILMIAALTLSACNPLKVAEQIGQGQQDEPAQPAGQAAQQQQQQPTATPKASAPTATPKPEAEPEEELPAVVSLEEAGISSYRELVTSEIVMGGESQITTILTEYTAEGPATHTVITSGDADDDRYETIHIGGVTYVRAGQDDEWVSMQISGQDPEEQALGILTWADPTTLLENDACKDKGRVNVEGEQTRHYHCDKAFFMLQGFWEEDVAAELEEAYLDYYVSTKYNAAIKTVMHWEGLAEQGDTLYHIESLVTDINKPIVIQAPAGAKAPGVDDDIPVPDNADQMSSIMGMVSFTVPDDLADVVAWYDSEMSARGWTVDPNSVMEMAQVLSMKNWSKADRIVNIMISNDGESDTSVIISIEQ